MSHTKQQNMNLITGLASLIASLSALLFLWFLGIGESVQVLRDASLVTPATLAAFGGTIGFLDKVIVFTIWATAIGGSGLALYSTSRESPDVMIAIERNLPMIIGIVGLVGFYDMVSDMIQGNRTWGTFTDVQNAYNVFIGMSVVTAVLQFFGNEPEY